MPARPTAHSPTWGQPMQHPLWQIHGVDKSKQSLATLATLIVLPSVFSLVQQSARVASVSLDPHDPASAYHV